jgi:hypothetical protein
MNESILGRKKNEIFLKRIIKTHKNDGNKENSFF